MLNKLRYKLIAWLTPKTETHIHSIVAEARTMIENASQELLDMLDFILPKIAVESKTDPGKLEMLHDESRAWADACAQTVGFIAGMMVKPGRVDSAVNEMLVRSKRLANMIQENRAKLTGQSVPTQAPPPAQPSTPSAATMAEITKQASLDARKKQIEELELQVEAETNPDVQATLKQIVQRMRAELELDKVA